MKRRKSSFLIQTNSNNLTLTFVLVFWGKKNLCKSLQTLNLMLQMCCHINVRSNQTVHATREDQRIKMSGQQRWLQKIAFSGHLLLVGVTHEQGEKLSHNTEFLLTVQKGGRCAGFSRGMLFLDTDKWSYSKKEKKMQCFLKNCLLTPKKVQESIVTKITSSRAKLPKLQSPLCHLILCNFGNVPSLCLSIHTCKVGIVIAPHS